ncbi:MAG: hypothetical protein CM15mP6_3300 [Methanobacteriota archaeon]|nr:MAG: hypothetical protein CM15mP6_3300 [Euryarchaeota archaeon]
MSAINLGHPSRTGKRESVAEHLQMILNLSGCRGGLCGESRLYDDRFLWVFTRTNKQGADFLRHAKGGVLMCSCSMSRRHFAPKNGLLSPSRAPVAAGPEGGDFPLLKRSRVSQRGGVAKPIDRAMENWKRGKKKARFGSGSFDQNDRFRGGRI